MYDLLWELPRLLLQLMGAALIAWLTVRWAIKRFKTEKVWERQTTALADVVAALSEMRRITGRFFDEHISGTDFSEEYQQHLRERYRQARREFESVVSVARLLLPENMANLLHQLEKDLGSLSSEHVDWVTVMDARWGLLNNAIDELVRLGREYFANR